MIDFHEYQDLIIGLQRYDLEPLLFEYTFLS